MIKAIIFDMDGVLIDSEPLHTKAVADVLREMGYEPDEILKKYRVGARSYGKTWADIKEELGLAMPLEEITRRQFEYSYEMFDEVELFEIEGATQIIEKAKELGFAVAVGSSAPVRLINIILRKLGMMDLIETYCGVEYVKTPKPAPDIYEWVAKDLKLQPQECMVIEDSPTGIKSAKAAGMFAMGIMGSGYTREELAQADIIVEDFEEATKFICDEIRKDI